jgi:hypothetical protein
MSIDEELKRIAEEENKRYNIEALDEAVRNLALAQMRMLVRSIMLTLEANGDVTISHVLTQPGGSYVPYAHVRRFDGKLMKTSSRSKRATPKSKSGH